jgi:hypothetical protein
MSDARKFLESVLVWPGDANAPGWINVHVNSKNDNPSDTSKKNNEGKPWTPGWPFKTVDDALSRINWTESTDRFFNAWVCMSQQSECTKSQKTGKPKALRKALNATYFKAIWVDVDVKANSPKHYASHGDAWAAVAAFYKKVGLPKPSIIVDSGGGLHVYWTSDRPLTLDEWRPYAAGLKALLLQEGVKCDAGLTTDAARILRVPGTLNHKYDPPRMVKLLHCGKDYDFASDLGVLLNVTVAVTTPTSKPTIVIEPGVVFDCPHPAFAALAPDNALQAGIEPAGLTYVDPRPIFAKDGCRWLREALRTGGAGFDQPQWNLSVLCTVFMENGDAIAHKISKGHTTYQPPDTQALYDRKVEDRAARGIGYPSCAAIAGAGSTHCAACPHFSKGKSPLNIRAVAQTPAINGKPPLLLPEEYFLGEDKKIYLTNYRMVKGEAVPDHKKLFHNSIDDAYSTKNPEALHLHISMDKGHWDWTSVRKVDFAGSGFEKKLAEAGLDYCGENKTKLEAFLMSFLARMKEAAEQQPTVKFGWYRPKGPIEGFAYAGHIYKVDGSITPASYPDANLRKRYQPSGTLADWHTTASYIFRQRRPDFDAVIAVAFAAPLMELTGTTGGIVASMGEKGSGKSYAMECAAAVWGNHKQTIERQNSTDNSLLHKLGATGHLPAFWDEISDQKSQAKFLKVSSQISGGGDGGRLTQTIKQQDRGEWSTIVNINGNKSWRDYVVTQQKDHGAGLRRVLEYWVPKNVPNPQGQVMVSEAESARALLLHNYGEVGAEYARYLVTHMSDVQRILQRNTNFFEAKLQPDKEESMWLAMCATLLTGAELATLLPTPVPFNTARLADFLINVFLDNRRYSSSANVAPIDTAEDYLAQYLKDRSDATIWTHGTPHGKGRPGVTGQVEWRRLQPNASTRDGISVRWDRQSMTLAFSKTNFSDWAAGKPDKRDPSVIARALEKQYGLRGERRTLCAGTPFKMPREWLYVIDVSPYPELKEIMDAFVEQTNLNADLGTSTQPSTVGAPASATGTGP